MVYKPHCRTPLELLSTAGFRAYLLLLCLMGLEGLLRAQILAHGWVSSRIQAVVAKLVAIFYFFPDFLFYLFCFVSTYNKILIYFILFCF